jgi:hypothetical protein
VRFNQGAGPALALAGLGLFSTLTFSAWMHIQAMRLSYRAQALRRSIAEWERREQSALRRSDATLSLARLDQAAQSRFSLRLPQPDQLRFVRDS